MNKKFAKLLAVSSFFLNNLEIFSEKKFDDGSSKRKKHRDKFYKDGNTGSNFLASQIISNNLDLFDNKEDISNLLKNKKISGEREEKNIKAFEEEFNKKYIEKTEEVKEHLNIIKKCLNNLEKFEFDGSEIDNIRKRILVEVEIIKGLDSEIKKSIQNSYSFNVTDKHLEDLIRQIKQKKIEKIDQVLSSRQKMVDEIQNKLNLAEKFIKSVEELNKISEDISVTDTEKSLDFLDRFAKYNSELIKIQNVHLENSIFYKNIFTENLLNDEEKEQYKKNNKEYTLKSLVNYKYKSFIVKFNSFFAQKTQDLKDELKNFDNNIKKENSEVEEIFKKNGLKFDESIKYDNKKIKELFGTTNGSDTIEDFSKNINAKNGVYSNKIDKFNNSFSEISKQFENLEKIKEKILNNKIDFWKNNLKANYNLKTQCFKNVKDKLEEVKKTKEKIEKNCEKYSKLVNETKKLKEQFYTDNNLNYNNNVIIDLTKPDEEIQKNLNIIYARVELSKKDSFILSKNEFDALQICINNEKAEIIKCIDENVKKLNVYNNSITNLNTSVSNNEKDLKKKINEYNKLLKNKKNNNDEYLKKIKEANEEIIKEVNKIENGKYKNDISKKIVENFYTHFRFLNSTITANSKNEIDNFRNLSIKLLIDKLPTEFKQIGLFTENINCEIKPNKEINKIINDASTEIVKLNNVNDNICKDIENLKADKEKLKGNLERFDKDKENLVNQIKSLNKFFGDNEQILEIYKDDKTLCDKYKNIVEDINKTSTNLEGVKINKITGENEQDRISNALDDKENDLGHGKDVVEKYKVNVFEEYNGDESNLYKAYKTIYNIDNITGKTLDNENIKFSEIQLRCVNLEQKLKVFFKELYNFISKIDKLDRNNIIKLDTNYNWFLNKHSEYIENNKFVTSSSLYFLEYFYHKKNYSEIENEITDIYNLLIKYKALLDFKNKSNKFENSLKTLNGILNRYFDDLFQLKSGKFILNKKFKDNTYYYEVLGEKKFLDNFEKLCNFYKLKDYDNSKKLITEILNKIDSIKDLDNIKNVDGSLDENGIINEINNIYKYINEIKDTFEKFSTSNLGDFEVNKKFDIILGNNLYCSDLNILSAYIGEIISEFVLLKEKSNDKSIFKQDNIDFKSLKFEKGNEIRNIYSILQICTYYKAIFDEKNSFFQSLIDLITKKLDTLYSTKIYNILKDLNNAFDYNDLNSFLGNIFDFTKDINELKNKIDLLYKLDKDSKEEKNNVFYKENGIFQSKLILSELKLKEIIKNTLPKNNLIFNKFNEAPGVYFKEDHIGFVESILNIWELQHELYENLCNLNLRYKGFVKFSDIEKIKFSQKVQNLKVDFKDNYIAPNHNICYSCSQDKNIDTELNVVLKNINKSLQKIYQDINLLYNSRLIADNIANYKFYKNIYKFFDENFKLSKKDFYNEVDDKQTILDCSKKELKLLDDNNEYKDIKDLLKYKGKTDGDTEFYFNYSLREKIAEIFNKFFSDIKDYMISGVFFNYDTFNNGNFKTNNDLIKDLHDCQGCFNFILNHVNFWGKFFKVFESIKNLLIELEFITENGENIEENKNIFSFSSEICNTINEFNALNKLKKSENYCDFIFKGKKIIKIPSIITMLNAFTELVSKKIRDTNKDNLLKNLLDCIFSNYDSKDFLKLISTNTKYTEFNHFYLLSLLNDDPTYEVLKNIFDEKVLYVYGYNFYEILKNYEFTKDISAYGILKVIFSNELKNIFPKNLSDEFSIGSHNLSELVILIKDIVTQINSYSSKYNRDIEEKVKDNFYIYIDNCLNDIKNNIDNDLIIDRIFKSLNNAKEHCERILAYDSIKFEHIKDDKVHNANLNLSYHLDNIFAKNNLENDFDLFFNNFLLLQAYYDNNVENMHDSDVYPFHEYYPDEIANKLKNSSLDSFFQNFYKMLFDNNIDDDIFEFLTSKKIKITGHIEGDNNYSKLLNLYQKLHEYYENSDYNPSLNYEKDNEKDKEKNKKILEKLNDIYNSLTVE